MILLATAKPLKKDPKHYLQHFSPYNLVKRTTIPQLFKL